jgi:tetratricopeptide (TPR) repeat protein
MWADIDSATDVLQKNVALCEKLAQEEPKNAAAQRDLAIAYASLGVNESQWGYVSPSAVRSKNARDYFNKSLDIRQKLVQDDPENREFQNELGESYEKLGGASSGPEQINAYKKNLEIRRKYALGDPRDPKAQRALATAYNCLASANLWSGNPTVAIELFRECCRFMPESGEAHEGLAWALLKEAEASGKPAPWDDAAAELALAVGLLEDNCQQVAPRKNTCCSIAHTEELFNRVVKLRPKETTLWVGRAMYKAKCGKWHDAASDFARVIHDRPLGDECVVEYVGLLILDGDLAGYKQACQEFKARLEATPDDDWAAYAVSYCFGLGPIDAVDGLWAVAWADRAVKAHPQVRWVHLAQALAQYRAGQFEAVTENVRAFSPGILFVRAMSHSRLGHTEEARRCFEEARRRMRWMQPHSAGGESDGNTMTWIEANVLSREAEKLFKSVPEQALVATPQKTAAEGTEVNKPK